MPKGQKGCCRGLKGCKDQLLISRAILHDCKSRKTNVCMAWTNYQKAFDSMPHSWIIKSLKLTGINTKMIFLTKEALSYWKTVCVYIQKGR